jgi:hypothetical protein
MVEAVLHRSDGRAEFRVTGADADAREALAAMGFGTAAGYAFRSFPDSDDVPRIFRHFALHVADMVRLKLREAPAPWEDALEVVADRLRGEVDWWLTGSAALAVRGIEVDPRDLDLVVDDAERTGALLADLLVEPVVPTTGWVADWFGRAFSGALIEWVGGVHDDSLQHGPDAARRRERIAWRGRDMLVSPVDVQLAVSELRGLTDQADAIRRFLTARA